MSDDRDPGRQRAFFEDLAARYDGRLMRSRWPRNQLFKAEWLLADLPEQALRGTVVEIGCGTGQVAELVLERAPELRYVGVDLSPTMLEVAEQRIARFGGRATVAEGIADRLPLEDGEADAAFGVDVLHHVPDPAATLREAARVVVPGGPVAFLEGNPKFPLTLAIALLRREERGLLDDNERNFRRWLAEAGLERPSVEYAPLFTPPGPPALVPLWDRLDRVLHARRATRWLAIFYDVRGAVPRATP